MNQLRRFDAVNGRRGAKLGIFMLSLALVGMGHVNYFCPSEGYYINNRHLPGVWHGRGAARWGAQGPITAEGLSRLFQRLSFDGTMSLVKTGVDDASRGGFDLTFSAPKSASALYAQSCPEIQRRIEDIVLESVKTTLDEFEPILGVTRRGKGGHHQESADGLIIALFPDLDSREKDPQVHVHAVVGNICPRSDGTWGTIDSRVIFSPGMKKGMGAAFRCELAHRLEQEFGLHCVQADSFFEIEGVPQEVIDEFSSRRQEIMAELEDKGFSSAQAKAIACLETRRPKEEIPLDELKAIWRERATAVGFTPERAQALLNQPCQAMGNAQQILADGIQTSLKRLEQTHRNKYREVELIGALAEYCQGRGVGLGEVRRAVSETLEQHPDVLPISKSPGQTTFTTREIHERERNILELGYTLRQQAGPTVSQETLDQLRRHPSVLSLNGEQRQAFDAITNESTRLAIVTGFAGVGKTTLIQAVREAYTKDGYELVGVAPTGKAALLLQSEANVPSMTIHRMIKVAESSTTREPNVEEVPTISRESIGSRRGIPSQRILVVDEAGMVGGKQMEKLLTLADEQNFKVIMIGDPQQLQPVLDTGGALSSLANRNGATRLETIVRQREEWAREAVKAIAEGRSQEGLELFRQHDNLTVAKNYRESIEALLEDWKREGVTQPALHLVILPTNAQVDALNLRMQQARLDAGLIDEPCIRCNEQPLHRGDRIVCTRNDASLGVRNGSFGEIKAIDLKSKTIEVMLDEGTFASISLEKYPSIRLGYATTIYRAQGATVDHCYTLLGGPNQDREMAYVQVSRAREKTHLYTNMFEAGKDLSNLAAQIKRSRHDEFSMEGIQRDPIQYGP